MTGLNAIFRGKWKCFFVNIRLYFSYSKRLMRQVHWRYSPFSLSCAQAVARDPSAPAKLPGVGVGVGVTAPPFTILPSKALLPPRSSVWGRLAPLRPPPGRRWAAALRRDTGRGAARARRRGAPDPQQSSGLPRTPQFTRQFHPKPSPTSQLPVDEGPARGSRPTCSCRNFGSKK